MPASLAPRCLCVAALSLRVQSPLACVHFHFMHFHQQLPSTAASPQLHFPTAFTEHFPVVHEAKYSHGMRVVTVLTVEAQHANLPKYGQKWSGRPPPRKGPMFTTRFRSARAGHVPLPLIPTPCPS